MHDLPNDWGKTKKVYKYLKGINAIKKVNIFLKQGGESQHH